MIIRRRQFWTILCACMAGAIFLIPKKDELTTRIIKDGDVDRALEMIGGQGGERPTAETIARLVKEYGSDPTEDKFSKLQFSLKLVEEPEEALNVLRKNDQYFDDDQKREFCETISKISLANEKPQIALKAYQWLNHSTGLDEKGLQKAITYSRFCISQNQGIDLLKDHMNASGKGYEDFSETFRSQIISLYREVNRGAEALPYLEKELKLAREKGSTSEAMDYFLQVSLESNKVIESLPVIEGYIQQTQVGQMSFADLLAREKTHETDADFMKFGYGHAIHCEWTSQLDKAFDYYAKLAFMGHKQAADRCFEIFAWLQKHAMMRELLAEMDLSRLSFEQIMAYADIEGDAANYSRADEILSDALSWEDADKVKVYAWKGIIALQQDKFEEVIQFYEKALSLDPKRYDLIYEIASIHNSLGRHSEALECYREIPIEEYDKDGLENYEMLAASLGEKKDLIAVSAYGISKAKKLSAKMYLDFAERLIIDRDLEEALLILEAGSEFFPESARIELARIDILVELKRPEKAFELLNKTFRRGDPRYLYRAFAVGQKMKHSDKVFALVELDDPLASTWDPTMRVELATLYKKDRDWDKAIAIWESMDANSFQILGMKAVQSFEARDYEAAAEYQEQYLEHRQASNPDQWMFMGDIYRRLDRRTESQRAYVLALQTIEEDLTRKLEDSPE